MDIKQLGVKMNGVGVGAAACCTTVAFASLACAASVSAANATSLVGMVALAGVAVVFSALAVGATTAYLRSNDQTGVGEYFKNVCNDGGVVITGIFQTAAQVMTYQIINSVINGVAKAVSKRIEQLFLDKKPDKSRA